MKRHLQVLLFFSIPWKQKCLRYWGSNSPLKRHYDLFFKITVGSFFSHRLALICSMVNETIACVDEDNISCCQWIIYPFHKTHWFLRLHCLTRAQYYQISVSPGLCSSNGMQIDATHITFRIKRIRDKYIMNSCQREETISTTVDELEHNKLEVANF